MQTNQREVHCPSCAGNMTYAPGTTTLKCEFCGNTVEIDTSDTPIQELDYEQYTQQGLGIADTQTVVTTQCESCGAHIQFDPNVVSERCPFCGSAMVVKGVVNEQQIKPGSILPFKINSQKATALYKKWKKKLWFAPNSFTRQLSGNEAIIGIYTPYWTFDADTSTTYLGRRGHNETSSNDVSDLLGGNRSMPKTGAVTRINWQAVSGVINHSFDDMLVIASNSLPANYANKLEPWDLKNAVAYNDLYLCGFRTETYQLDIQQGFEQAKKRMATEIDQLIKRDIGGDQQRISSRETSYSSVTFKHTLLPIYISAIRYKNRPYRFLVNGRSGRVQGERPYSKGKIAGVVLLVLAALLAIYLWISQDNQGSSNASNQLFNTEWIDF